MSNARAIGYCFKGNLLFYKIHEIECCNGRIKKIKERRELNILK